MGAKEALMAMTLTVGSAQGPFVLLEDRLAADRPGLLFEAPERVLEAWAPEEVAPALAALEEGLGAGFYAAGCFAYELGYVLEPRLADLLPADRRAPLLSVGLFNAPRAMGGREVDAFLRTRTSGGHRLKDLSPGLSQADYLRRIETVLEYIRAGDVYQINFTFPLDFQLLGDAVSLYRALRARQPVAHGGMVRLSGRDVLSLSPELFVEIAGGRLTARPMKGTAPRGADPAEDEGLSQWLREDPKSRAENLMIVDLLRNDLSRVAETGSVEVPDLFRIETFPSLHTMTSTVTARLRRGTGLSDILRGLYPCGSVTGAPKIRAMEIIRDLEDGPRGVYTGSTGYITPEGDLSLNVAIRTLTIDAETGRGVMGIGSGIVADSEPHAEYEECLLKARFLSGEADPFGLIETMRAEPGLGIALLPHHLARLSRSAHTFGFDWDERAVRAALVEAACVATPSRVRCVLYPDGRLGLTVTPLLQETGREWRVAIAQERLQAGDPYRGHKTTRRDVYDRALAEAKAAGADEALLLNEDGFVVEGAITTIFVERGGIYLTPPLEDGALPGALRASLADQGLIREHRLYPEDLAGRTFLLGNAVRGLIKARLIEAPAPSAREPA